MASFNPDAQVSELQSRDQTGASRGTGTNRAFESLFKGLGDIIGAASTVADNAVQNRIEKDARYGFDSLNDETYSSVDTVPVEVARTQEGIQTLADAYSQGRITQEYYYGRLSASLKGLRSKYPGYEKEVDSIVQNVTGVRPANAYRDALWSAAESSRQAQASAQGKMESWASQKENSEVLGVLYPDYWTNPEKYSSEESKAQVRANVSQYQGRIRIAEDTVKLQSADKAVAIPQVGRVFSTITNGYIVGGSEVAGIDSPNVQNMLSSALEDGKVDQDEQNNILGILAQVKAKAMLDMRNRVASAEWGSNFTAADINDQISQALQPITQMEELVTNGNISSAAQIAARNKAVTDQATADLYQKFPEIASAQALRGISEVAADTVVNDLITKRFNGSGLDFINATLGKDLASGVTSGTVTLNQVTERLSEAKGKTGKEKEGILSGVLDATTSVLSDPSASVDVKRKTAMATYADNLDATWSAVDDSTGSTGLSQRFRLFGKMFNPQITKEIANLGDPEALEAYTAAAVDKFQQIPEFRRAASTLGDQIPYNQYARVRYDEDRNRMIVEVNREALGNTSWFKRTDQAMARRELVRATDTFNQAVTLMAPIIEAQGVDESEGVAQLAESLALNLESGNPGIWSFIGNGITDTIDTALRGAGGPEGGIAKPGSKLYNAGKANQENQSRMTNPNETGEWEEIGTPQSSIMNGQVSPVSFTMPGEAEVEPLRTAANSESAILNLLGRSEGTDRGRGYDETLGYGAYTNGPVNLTEMTLDEVDALQRQMLRHPSNGYNSSAVGRYQIVGKTLRKLKTRLGLSGEEKFTPELQDRLAKALLEGRGYSRWKNGELGTKAFLNSLAQEWASLPTAKGRGHYKGQRAAVSTDAVLTALQSE